MCHVVPRDSSANKVWQSSNCIYFSFILLAEPLTDEGGEEIRVPKENPLTSFRKCHILKPENSSPNQDSNPHSRPPRWPSG